MTFVMLMKNLIFGILCNRRRAAGPLSVLCVLRENYERNSFNVLVLFNKCIWYL